MKEAKTAFELAIEKQVGVAVELIRAMPLDELGRAKVVSRWPLIGRGNLPRIFSRREIDKLVEKALK